ncbi:MAG: penicillin-binding protein 2 [Deltaproteobacteria bacterium]|nr:penicillin-binding protein 2 [Deltaproteobacteria bacterium]
MITSRNPFPGNTEDLRPRPAVPIFVVFLLFFLLFGRLWYLQIIKGHEYRALSENNRTRVQDILPTRGLILDRHGHILVDNHPAYDLALVREDAPQLDLLKAKLEKLLTRPDGDLAKNFEAARFKPAFQPALICADLERSELVSLETNRLELPGLVIRIKPRRKYLDEGLAAHVIGYLGEVSQLQLDLDEYQDHRMGDLVGRFGLERTFESSLKGKRGWRLVEVNASGRVLEIIKQVPPVPGHNLYLTLDTKIQQVAEEALSEVAGSLVALDPTNGEILAMASSPTFSQDDFIRGIASEKWQVLIKNPLHPLENRAISGQYMPGSVFKIVTALAGLEEGIITPETTITCTGEYQFGNRIYHCWRKRGHGKVNLHRALVESCDIYFYDVGKQLDIDRLARVSHNLGLGQRTGVGLKNEKAGLVPTTSWKKKRFKEPWIQGDSLHVAIGQGYNLVTPLQVAQMLASVVNGGTLYRPQLVKKITDVEEREVLAFTPEIVRQLDINKKFLALVKKGLVGAVNERRGTGRAAILKYTTVGGKTGTAQVVALRPEDEDEDDVPYKFRDHAWFATFAPAEEPRIVVVVIAEHAGHGGSAAAPLAKKVLEAFFAEEAGRAAMAGKKKAGFAQGETP